MPKKQEPPRSIIRRPEPRQESRSRDQQQKDRKSGEAAQAGAQALHPGRNWRHGKKQGT